MAFIGTSEKERKKMTLKVGLLKPQNTAVVYFKTIEQIEISGGAFVYSLPASFIPDY